MSKKAYQTLVFLVIIFLTGCVSKSYDKGSETSFVWPVKSRQLIGFGSKNYGVSLRGILISSREGEPVVASRSGKVLFVDEGFSGYGKTVLLEHSDGFVTVYAGSSEIFVKLDQWVRQGEPIARIGSKGKGNFPELYFEIRKNSRAVDPASYLSGTSASNPI